MCVLSFKEWKINFPHGKPQCILQHPFIQNNIELSKYDHSPLGFFIKDLKSLFPCELQHGSPHLIFKAPGWDIPTWLSPWWPELNKSTWNLSFPAALMSSPLPGSLISTMVLLDSEAQKLPFPSHAGDHSCPGNVFRFLPSSRLTFILSCQNFDIFHQVPWLLVPRLVPSLSLWPIQPAVFLNLKSVIVILFSKSILNTQLFSRETPSSTWRHSFSWLSPNLISRLIAGKSMTFSNYPGVRHSHDYSPRACSVRTMELCTQLLT